MRKSIFKNCHLSSVIDESGCRMMLASILPNLSNFDVKMTSNRRAKFGSARKLLYLCIVKNTAAAPLKNQHSTSNPEYSPSNVT